MTEIIRESNNTIDTESTSEQRNIKQGGFDEK